MVSHAHHHAEEAPLGPGRTLLCDGYHPPPLGQGHTITSASLDWLLEAGWERGVGEPLQALSTLSQAHRSSSGSC